MQRLRNLQLKSCQLNVLHKINLQNQFEVLFISTVNLKLFFKYLWLFFFIYSLLGFVHITLTINS